jgi:hypothetical protein
LTDVFSYPSLFLNFLSGPETPEIYFSKKKITASYKQYLHVVEVAFSVTYWHQKKQKIKNKKDRNEEAIYASKVIIRLIHNI